MRTLFFVLALLAASGSWAESPAAAGASDLQFSQSGPQRIEGTLRRPSGQPTVSFRGAEDLQSHELKSQVTIGGKAFDAAADPQKGSWSFDGHGAVLTPEDQQAAVALLEELNKQTGTDAQTPAAGLVRAVAGLIASTAPGVPSERQSSEVRQRSLGEDGVDCIGKGGTATAKWDDNHSNSPHSKAITVGNSLAPRSGDTNKYGCVGMCGPGCLHYGYATRDCMDHDLCQWDNKTGVWGGGLPSSPCYDEYLHGTDDVTVGQVKCR